MKHTLNCAVTTFVVILCISFVVGGFVYSEEMKGMHGEEVDMKLHHLHLILNHGLEMVLEGSSQVMIAQMKMAPTLDTTTLSHGQEMMKNGDFRDDLHECAELCDLLWTAGAAGFGASAIHCIHRRDCGVCATGRDDRRSVQPEALSRFGNLSPIDYS